MAYRVISREAQGLRGDSRLFGTSRVRGVVGKDLTLGLCYAIGKALGTRLAAQSKICLATDARQSRQLIKEAITPGLLCWGYPRLNSRLPREKTVCGIGWVD